MKRIIFIFFTILFISLAVSGTAFAEELYFNESGDLIFSTYDKKATSQVKYKTVGWVIKRYNDSIYAEGQNFVNIPKSGYIYEMADPGNPEYLYTTFIMDGTVIMNCIAQVSKEWEKQLRSYGGYVYIDSIMTICEWGMDTGGIYSSGEMYGEIYNSYEGIRNARAWADGDTLRAYYDLMVKYPYTVTPLSIRFVTLRVDNHVAESRPASSFKIGSFEADNEKYDVSQGIPSGENLYLYGTADKFKYRIDYQEISGAVYVPVMITTTYKLKWYDTVGNYHEENQWVDRWYYVKKDFDYTQVINVKKYDLSAAVFSSECSENVTVDDTGTSAGTLKKQYGDSCNHVQVNSAQEYYAGVVDVLSSNHQRPSIPDEDQQYLAEKLVLDLTVWSDRAEIDNRSILSDKKCIRKGKSILLSLNVPQQTIYKTEINIPKEKQNREGYRSTVRLVYSAGTEYCYVDNSNINPVTVHTPVAATLTVNGDKSSNENMIPSTSDLVIGDKFVVLNSAYGNHREIKGYGLGYYSKYVKKMYVRVPFPVIYGVRTYPENTWIEVNSYWAVFRIPEYVKEGKYDMECMTAAVNIPSGYLDSGDFRDVVQEKVNSNINKYCAVDKVSVNVIGKLYGFTVENNGERYKTGTAAVFPEPVDCSEETLPVNITKVNNPDNVFRLGIYANGIGDENGERIDMDISYYIMEENEMGDMERRPVDIYEAEGGKITADSLLKIKDRISIPTEEAVKVKDGVYYFTQNFEIPDKLILVEKNRDISDISVTSDYILHDKTIIVNMDIYGTDANGRKLSYENSKNEQKGYCNMWKKEGFRVDKYKEMALKCGDVILMGMEGTMKNYSQIIGTH